MNNIKHIHEVIFLIEKNNKQWTPEELVEAMGNTWARIFTLVHALEMPSQKNITQLSHEPPKSCPI